MAGALLPPLTDPYHRKITYLRVSVTDRCDFRCVYCMSEDMNFLPRGEILSLEELDRVCGVFIASGVRKLRLTGGEPLVRRNVMTLIRKLGQYRADGRLDDLTLTTNGGRLVKYADALYACGLRRINVSLDTLDAAQFRMLTRWGSLDQVLAGIMAARAAGLQIKINCVALKGVNDGEFDRLVAWCGDKGFDLVFIEVMSMGAMANGARVDQYLPLSTVRERLARRWTLSETDYRTSGPARYWVVGETGCRVGFIAPTTENFCKSCTRVRLTCTGLLYTCLGHEDAVDLRTPLRASEANHRLIEAIAQAISRKSKGHDFVAGRDDVVPASPRHMNVTGG
ncbi:MAG: GTP 3',8-cyclase MoaA [Azospirillaceae bacterium]|nr:GTP 3',8-cyclase MoaA [Azospirillaceae bacterium]